QRRRGSGRAGGGRAGGGRRRAMNLAELTEQIRALQDRMRRGDDDPATADGDDPLEAHEVLGVAFEELSVAGEQLLHQNDELRVARRALEEERLRYRDLFEHAPDAYLVTDPWAVIREVNQKAAELFNLRKGFLVGKPLLLFVAEEARPAFLSELNRL